MHRQRIHCFFISGALTGRGGDTQTAGFLSKVSRHQGPVRHDQKVDTCLIGIVVGSMSAASMCGSVFTPKSRVAELYDTLRGSLGGTSSCEKSIAAAAVPTWILIVLGVALVLVGIIVRAIGKNRAAAPRSSPVRRRWPVVSKTWPG